MSIMQEQKMIDESLLLRYFEKERLLNCYSLYYAYF